MDYEKRKYYSASISEQDLHLVSQWGADNGYTVARAIRVGLKLFIERHIKGKETMPEEIFNPGNRFESKPRDEDGRILREDY